MGWVVVTEDGCILGYNYSKPYGPVVVKLQLSEIAFRNVFIIPSPDSNLLRIYMNDEILGTLFSDLSLNIDTDIDKCSFLEILSNSGEEIVLW